MDFNWSGLFDKLNEGATRAGFRFPEATAAETAAGVANPQAGQWNRDRIGQTLGMLATALAPKDSWQQRLGAVATGMGTSNIYGRAQERADREKQTYVQSVIRALGGLTSKGVTGPTTYSEDADGTFNIKGNVPGVGPQTKVGGVGKEDLTLGSPNIPGTPSAPTAPMSGGGAGPYDTLIKALSGFQGSPAGLTSADYAGLSPEMIDALAGRSMQGQRLGLETADFLREVLKPGEAERRVQIDGPNGNIWLMSERDGSVFDTGIPLSKKADLEEVTLSDGVWLYNKSTGQKMIRLGDRAPSDRANPWEGLTTIEYYNPKDGRPMPPITTTYARANAERARLAKEGFVVGNAPTPRPPGEITEQEQLNLKAGISAGTVDPVDVQNKTADPNSRIIYDPGKGLFNLQERVTLPGDWTMGDVQKVAKGEGVTVWEAYQMMLEDNKNKKKK